jgi:LDH2 family malate/lactate/ureidoglycolate dehydrogenase
METQRYRAEDLVQFGRDVLVQVGYPAKQAYAAAKILVEADLIGDHAHGIAGSTSLEDIIQKVHDDESKLGFKRFEIADFSKDKPKYPTIISVDAHGTLGHYVALEIIPDVIDVAKELGYAKAYIRNSTHFGDCGIYTDMIAHHDLAARVTSTAPQWMKPFIELQDKENEDSPLNKTRYDGVRKRFGTNPIAWSIPYEGGIITIDMAATQRAVSPPIQVANYNSQALGIYRDEDGIFHIPIGNKKKRLSEVHLAAARSENEAEVLRKLGYQRKVKLVSVEKGLLKGPEGEDIHYPLAFDDVMKNQCWMAPLGGTYFGYKGFGLNMLIELDNVVGGGVPEIIRVLDEAGNPTTPERVSHTVEVYAIDIIMPLAEAKKRLKQSVDTTIACGNTLMLLPGQREQETRRDYLTHGVPMTRERIDFLRRVADDNRVRLPFELRPANRG